ncbi:AAA family ATPase [Haloarcula sp. CBA1130]|uniref:Cdc6/Cdc18 family protein n=1 Tax=unclassified Haloarcula TaxID=2624677 RepID=UPI0012480713|nr:MULTISPECIES: orc1/cdc6 family replication initiation protein [unclassified Haloarcula]KAA9396241.1 AAA family ATPase [Haloarcula sp. CBA1129]KAA9396375.1 AAA family ATPase [Haloarcula sp. CBA1130]KAA9397453.1 AAA family ATPase [Haloarcula sp. CBA1129]
MDSPFDEPGKIFADKRPLDEDYTPETILCREDEVSRYSEALQDVIEGFGPNNVFIYGQTGNGKTVVTKKMMQFLRAEAAQHDVPVTILEINCNKDDSIFSVLISLVNQLRPPDDQVPEQGPTKGFLWSTLYDELDDLEGDVVVVLDEIDMLGADNDKLLYEFPRARKMGSLEDTRVGVIGISNNHMFKDSLDPRVKSTLCEYEIFFSPYDATELTDILQHYGDLVFRDGIIDEGVIQLCAARAAQEQGDAREALDLLETAGNIARKHDAGQVTKAHVEEAGSRVEEQRVLTIVREQLTSQMKLALLATAFLNIDDEASPRAKNIYQVYENICEVCGYEPRSKRRVNDFLDSIRLYGLLERDERNLGRAGGRSYIHTLEVSPELVFEGLKQDQDGSESTLERYDLVPDPDEAQQARLMSYV